MKFLDEIRDELRPDDVGLKEVDLFIVKINNILKENKISARCVRGGSTAKGTFLKGDHDVDLFVIFDYSYKSKDISKMLFESIKSLSPEVVHGSRDYFWIKKKSMTYELVPVLEVKDPRDIENVTDMSPHHVAWVNKRLNEKLRDDIRLAKKFCKAQKIYGAESYIKGFSGHVIDILIIYYNGFVPFLKAASGWKPKVIIDPEKKIKNALKELDKSKTYGPLIIIDPVQPERNAAAAISEEAFGKFVSSAKDFLKNPSKGFFIEKTLDISEIKRKKGKNALLVFDVNALLGKTDIVGAKLIKAFEYIKKQLGLNDFTVIESGWNWDKKKTAQFYFLIKEAKLSKTMVRQGPPLNEKDACIAFKAKNNDVFEKDKRLYANVKRRYVTPEALAKDLIKTDNIKSRVAKIKLS